MEDASWELHSLDVADADVAALNPSVGEVGGFSNRGGPYQQIEAFALRSFLWQWRWAMAGSSRLFWWVRVTEAQKQRQGERCLFAPGFALHN